MKLLDDEIREAVHAVIARTFERISKEAGGLISVEDIKVENCTVSVSVTLKTRHPFETVGSKPT